MSVSSFKSGTFPSFERWRSLANGIVVNRSDFTILALSSLDGPGVDVLVLNSSLGRVKVRHDSISTVFGSVWVKLGSELLCSDQVSRGLLRVSQSVPTNGGAAPSQVDLSHSHRWNKNSAPIRAAFQATSTTVHATSRPLWMSRVACTQLSRLDIYGRKIIVLS